MIYLKNMFPYHGNMLGFGSLLTLLIFVLPSLHNDFEPDFETYCVICKVGG